ncbi:MAG: DUF4287 domain-containing protein [Thermaceae bacterium]|nr:DUF4287 domain-containing protein [Thermaceae bacterium]
MSDKGAKIFQSYLENIRAKTGKTPADFAQLAAQKGLTKHGEIVSWLKTEFGLGHGHANAIVGVLLKSDSRKGSTDAKLEKIFAGTKTHWRETYDALWTKVAEFGEDVKIAPTQTYVSLLRSDKKFAIVQPSSAERLDLGIKLKGVKAEEGLETAGSWNAMVTHRVRVTDPKQIDNEVLKWLRQAYDLAK